MDNQPTLRMGDQGPAVREMQNLLNRIGFNTGGITGIFGPLTDTAVRSFQRDNNLDVTGVVNQSTWEALRNAPRTLRGIVIDAGHGGNDPGAVHNGIFEKDFTLKMSIYMAEKLRDLNIPVQLVRTTDETLTLTQRTTRINSFFSTHRDVIVISNHLNAAVNTAASGAEIIFALRNTPELANNILDGIVNTGIGRRSAFQRPSASNQNLDHFAVLRDTNPSQSLIVEYGFISNQSDANFITANWQRLVDGAVEGLKTYLQNNYQLEITNPTNDNEYVHIVRTGETLFSIARMYNITVDELIRLNNLTSTVIHIGQRLLIAEHEERYIYTVVPGDTLWGIANRFNTTVEQIISINNLSSPILSIGQELIIPIDLKTYTVEGDTLEELSNRFNITKDQIKSLNNLTNDILCVGQELLIPREKPSS